MLRTLVQLPRTVWLLSLVSFFNDTASELVYPLIPLYLAAVLHAGPRTLGLIEGIAEATGSLLKLVSGVVADRVRRSKQWVVVGYGVSAIAKPLFAFATSWPVVLLLRFGDKVGKGLRTSPRDAMLARAIAPNQRGLAYGVYRAMDNLGAVVGPLLAAALIEAQVSLRHAFLWASLGGVAAVLGTMAVREPAHEISVAPVRLVLTMQGLPTVFKRYLVVLALFTLGNSSNMFLLLRARELGLSDAQVPLLWALVSFMASAFSTPLSALSDRVGRKWLIVCGWAVYAGFYLLLTAINVGLVNLIWPLFAIYGLFMALTEGAEKAFVADVAPSDAVGTAFGWFNLISGFMLLPASLLFGVIWNLRGPETAFGFSALCAAGAAALMLWWVRDGKAEVLTTVASD